MEPHVHGEASSGPKFQVFAFESAVLALTNQSLV
jgi:hypothetical protein